MLPCYAAPNMSQLNFRVLEMRRSEPEEWLNFWAKRYPASYDEAKYNDLIKRHASLSADDFRRIGQWKDEATTDNQWKPNVASVAYRIWEQAADELPKCPQGKAIAAFLKDWSGREYTDNFESGPRKKHFGLSRATTLLHFISGGQYPIYDSRVRTAIARLLDEPEMHNDVSSYLDSYIPRFEDLARHCDTVDRRMLDKALFSYGALDKSTFTN